MAPKKTALESVCLGCSKKFTNKCASILCTVCGLWIHKACSGVTDEIFDLLDKQFTATGMAYWACKPCTVYAQGMNHRMRGIEESISEVRKTATTNSADLRKVEEQVNELKLEIKKNDNVVTREELEAFKKEMRDESRERKARELNVVMYGVEENREEGKSGRDKWEWDMLTCRNIFRRLDLKLSEENIKFCRRVGEKGPESRPMIVGLYNHRDRSTLLGQDTRGTELSENSFAPDLTKEQRKEDADLRKEVEDKNNTLSVEDRSKNLAWRLVGPRGERRLVKGVARAQEEGMSRNRGTDRRRMSSRGLSNRGPNLLPPRTGLGRTFGEAMSTRGMRGQDGTLQEEDLMVVATVGEQTRSRLASKRKERDEQGAESSEPPPKH